MIKRLYICLLAFCGLSLGPFYAQQPEANDDLFAAVAAGDRTEVERILEENPEASKIMRSGLLPVHLAASRGQLEILQAICRRDPSMIRAKARDGSSLIMISMESCQHGVTAWLIQNSEAAHRQEILARAAKDALNLYPRSLPTLFEAGWRPKSKENLLNLIRCILYLDDVALFDKIRPLGISAAIVWDKKREPGDQPDDEHNVLRFLNRPQLPPKIPLRPRVPSDDRTGGERHLASFLAMPQAVRTIPLLIEQLFTEPPHWAWQEDVKAAAFDAVKYGNLGALEILFASGKLDVNSTSSEGTLLQLARDIGSQPVIQWLLSKGAKDPNPQ